MPDASLIDFYLHPPLGLLTPTLDTNSPYGAGNHQITSFSGSVPVSTTYGILLRMATLNPAQGYVDGFVSLDGQVDGNVYFQQLCQVGVQHQLAGGAWVLTQLVNVDNIFMPIMWNIALPGRLGLLVAPGNAVDVYYLHTV